MRKITITRQTPKTEKETLLKPNTHLEIFGRITKIIKRRRGDDYSETIFQVVTPKTGYVLTCSSPYFSPIMETDAIFAKGFVDEDGKTVNISSPPFISPGNDTDSVTQACIIALGGRDNTGIILKEIKKLLDPGEELSFRIDYLATSFTRYGKKVIANFVSESLLSDVCKLLAWWHKKRCLRRLYLLDFTNTEIKASGLDSLELYHRCIENPYRILSLSLDRCDAILARFGKTPHPTEKYCGQIMRHIKKYLDDKWAYIPRDIITKSFADFNIHERNLIHEYGLYATEEYVAIEKIVDTERKVANFIKDLLFEKDEEVEIDEIEPYLGICDEDQKKAIIGILTHHIAIITGPAGTGKTTLLKAVTNYFDDKDIPYMMSSFTGKAVARIKEVVPTSSPLTIHRLISRGQSNNSESSEEEKPFKYLIIDEVSMLETKLFLDLINRFPIENHRYKVIFIGDINQLSPIGWGCFFQEIIKTEKIPTYRLTINHRSEGVGIVLNAQRLLDGYFFEATPDFQLCFGTSPLDIIRRDNLPIENTRILTPYVKSVNEYNIQVQDYFLGEAPYLMDNKGKKWYLHDRVMMTKNNYTINVMNGQEGFVTGFEKEEGLYIVFNGQPHLFTFANEDHDKILACYPPSSSKYLDVDTCEEIVLGAARKKKFWDEEIRIAGNSKVLFHNLQREIKNAGKESLMADEDSREFPPVDHLILCYALTIHKAQGSEWDYVIIYLPDNADPDFVTRDVEYPAITRGKKRDYLTGSKKTWIRGIMSHGKETKQLLSNFIIE